MDNQTKKDFKETIDKYNRFLLCLHVNADADSLCSNIAMFEFLTSLGKRVTILAGKNNRFSRELAGLSNWLKLVANHTVEEIDFGQYDCFIMLDAYSEERLYDTKHMPLPKVVIDHHESNTISDAEFLIVDSAYSSASHMVYDLCFEYAPHSRDYLLAVYMGIYSDTGGFRYGVSSEVHEVCSYICKQVDPSGLVKNYNQSIGVEDISVLSIATTNIKDFSVGDLKIYATTISQKDIRQKFGILDVNWNSNIAIRFLSEINGADVICVASEEESGLWRMRFRSFVEGLHAKILAESFGGGGHKHAASGTFLNNEPRAVIAEVKKHVEELFG